MTHFKHGVTLLAAAALLVGIGDAAAQHKQAAKGSTVTLVSCVEKAQNGNGDKLVLTHVADVPAQPATHGRVVYWIEDVSKLKPHIGHQVRITGKVAGVEKSEIEIRNQATGAVAEIEGHGTEVKTTPDKARVSNPGQTPKEQDIPTTVVTLALEKVEIVADRCKLAQ
jgi:hypothetical protein